MIEQIDKMLQRTRNIMYEKVNELWRGRKTSEERQDGGEGERERERSRRDHARSNVEIAVEKRGGILA